MTFPPKLIEARFENCLLQPCPSYVAVMLYVTDTNDGFLFEPHSLIGGLA